MGRRPCCTKEGTKRGAWTATEDEMLVSCIRQHGEGKWGTLPSRAGLRRCGKSCRLRWLNYLRPGIKRGNISADEDDLILRLHRLLGNRWSLIAGRLPGRTDNEIKNYWNTTLSKRLQSNTSDHQCSAKLQINRSGAAPGAARRRSPEPAGGTSPIHTKAVQCTTALVAATAAEVASRQAASAPGAGGGHAEESVEQSAGAGEKQEDWCVPVEEMVFDLDDIDLGFLSPWRGDLLGDGGVAGAADLEEALLGAMGDGDYHLELAPPPWLL